MADGVSKIEINEATNKAEQMKKLADSIETLLADVDTKMQEINDEETGTYQGQNRPSELRQELDTFRSTFYKFHDQINLFADNVIAAANTMLSE